MGVSKTVAVLLVIACALAGCSANSVDDFSLTLVNCQSLGIVSLTDDFFNTGTVCGTVDKTTADYICSSLYYGTAVNYGTAADKGVSGGTGIIEATELKCDSSGDCTFSTDTGDCFHSQDLVLQCSGQPSVCISVGAIVGIAIAVLFVCIIALVTPCVCCCVCACMGVACFTKSPSYNQL